MKLAEILDRCFDKDYVPHILNLICRYLLDLRDSMNTPVDIYLELLEKHTRIENDHGDIKFYVNNEICPHRGISHQSISDHRIYSVVNVEYYPMNTIITYRNGTHEYYIRFTNDNPNDPYTLCGSWVSYETLLALIEK